MVLQLGAYASSKDICKTQLPGHSLLQLLNGHVVTAKTHNRHAQQDLASFSPVDGIMTAAQTSHHNETMGAQCLEQLAAT